MAVVHPNDPCPCLSDLKFKKCCGRILSGEKPESPDVLMRARHAALVQRDINFLWETLHPMNPRRLKDTRKRFENDMSLLKNLQYRDFKIVDEKQVTNVCYRVVIWVVVYEDNHDISYLEESTYECLDGQWYYRDGLRKSSLRLGCLPESVKVGELEYLYLGVSEDN